MLLLILQCIYVMMPAYFANMAPVICRFILPQLDKPLDGNKKLGKQTIFGSHKTYRGIVVGIVFAIIISFLQYLAQQLHLIEPLQIISYEKWLLIGFLMGLGAMLGDLIESFIKRRMNIKPGKFLRPWDQIDFVIGALIFTYALFKPGVLKIGIIILISFVLHVLINHSAFYLKLRKQKW